MFDPKCYRAFYFETSILDLRSSAMKILCAFSLLLILFSCEKHDSYTITGTLYHHYDRIPISEGSIDFFKDGEIDAVKMSSPSKGVFTFENVPFGEHEISAVAYVGQDTITGKVTLKTGGFSEYHVDIGRVDEPGHNH